MICTPAFCAGVRVFDLPVRLILDLRVVPDFARRLLFNDFDLADVNC